MENEETQETQEVENDNNAPTAEDLDVIKAQLEEERAGRTEAQAALTDKDNRIAQLQAEGEALRTERSNLQQAHAHAVGKYLDAVKAANPTLPPDIIAGATIEDIDASLETAQSIADAVKASLAAEAKAAKVPAGAPTRAIDLSALTPGEKISLGLSQKGGTS